MEKYKKGGYTILDLESSTIYADSVKALDSNKPVVVYDGTNKPYFADTISLSGTSIIITKGGKTITIANDNTITNVGDIQNHLYRYDFHMYILGGEGDSLDGYFSLTTNISDLDFVSNTKLTNEILNKLPLYKGLSIADDSSQNIVCFWAFSDNNIDAFGATGSSITFTRNVDSDTIETINKVQLF